MQIGLYDTFTDPQQCHINPYLLLYFNVTSNAVKRMLALKRFRLSSTMSSSSAVVVGGAGPLPVPLAVILSGRRGTLPTSFLLSAGMAEW